MMVNERSYEEVAGELKELLKEYDVFRELVCAYHDTLLGGELSDVARTRLIDEYDIAPVNLPNAGFLELELPAIHRMMPYASEKINRLRSNIFLLGLELHEWAIRVNARQFNSNLNSFIDMLTGRH